MVRTAVNATRPVPGGKALASPRLSRHGASAAAQGCAHARHGQPNYPETSHTCKHTQADRASRMARNTVTVVLQGQTLALADVPLAAGSISSSPASHATPSVTTDINAMRSGCVRDRPIRQSIRNHRTLQNSTAWRAARVLSAFRSTGIALCSECWHCLRNAPPTYSSECKKFISPFKSPRCAVRFHSWWGKNLISVPHNVFLHLSSSQNL